MTGFRCAFTIGSDTRYLALLRQWVAAVMTLAGPKKKSRAVRTACTLALVEAVDNAIFHAHRRNGKLPVRIFMSFSGEKISIEVADCGKGLGRHVSAKPGEMINHGRGLFLIHRLMDSVESRMKNGVHILRMTYEF